MASSAARASTARGPSSVSTTTPAGVVAGRDGLAVVLVAGLAQQRAELHDGVAVDARAGRPAVEVGGDERLDDPRAELPLEVHDVERDPEPRGDPAGVVGGVGRAAAAAVLGVGVRDVVEAHPDADDLVPLLVEQRRGDRAVDAARHGDEDPAHPAATPGGARGRRRDVRGARDEPAAAMTSGTTRLASSISASVVERPRLRRTAPRASSSG